MDSVLESRSGEGPVEEIKICEKLILMGSLKIIASYLTIEMKNPRKF